jgi:predicted RNA-binding protein with PUA-like domain
MWLLKTEPAAYGYADLEREGRTVWDGVSNPAALKNIRGMKEGDRAFVYHTGGERRAVGIARIVRGPYPDPGADDPRRVVVDIAPVARLRRPVGLDEIKSLAAFAGSPLVRQGRLSVVRLTAAQWKAIESRSRS